MLPLSLGEENYKGAGYHARNNITEALPDSLHWSILSQKASPSKYSACAPSPLENRMQMHQPLSSLWRGRKQHGKYLKHKRLNLKPKTDTKVPLPQGREAKEDSEGHVATFLRLSGLCFLGSPSQINQDRAFVSPKPQFTTKPNIYRGSKQL